ncbi:MAG TPA: hypothetical protein VK843_20670 [Planctomycetota bacterium]|nr:hypothetical protein [Planctomycetota bacterium]
MKDPSIRGTLVFGWVLLAVFLPLGMTLEALHALKLPVYLGSPLRRELWTLAHAHGNLLGIVCLVFAALAERAIPDEAPRRTISIWLRVGALLLPLGFFLGGILNYEGDPSLGILLVPVGGLCLLYALLRAALIGRKTT